MISIVVPVLNEEAAVPVFATAIEKVLEPIQQAYEIVFVDDGSTDGTCDAIEALIASGAPVRLVQLSRNFGKEAALTAGLAHAQGQAVVPMDVDLQDPPELLPALLSKRHEGHQVVLAIRSSRVQDSWPKRTTAGLHLSQR